MSDANSQAQSSPLHRVYVWDPLVRTGHWLLVVAFTIAYLTGEDQNGISEIAHTWSGYLIAALIVVRVLWGLVGPRHARFTDFVYVPSKVAQYLIDLMKRKAPRYIGHSPAGGAMVVALLLFLAATVTTGLMVYGNEGKGPLAAASPTIVTRSYADEDSAHAAPAAPQSPGDDLLEEVHGLLANLTLALVILHVLGVGLASVVHHENLVASMINGHKRDNRAPP